MSRVTRERASRLAEFREAHAAYRETRSKEHALWCEKAMRSKDVRESDFRRAAEIKVEQVAADKSHMDDVLRRSQFSGWEKKET